jgi:two-component system, LuxR family, response regulator FixJ
MFTKSHQQVAIEMSSQDANDRLEREMVFLVDADPVTRGGVRTLLESVPLHVTEFSSGVEFLESIDRTQPGIVIMDLRLPDISGLDLLRKLSSQLDPIPALVLTAFADVRSAVEAMKLGAIHVLEKPYQSHELIESVLRGLQEDRERFDRSRHDASMVRDLSGLTPREREVLGLLLQGNAAKQIAKTLEISIRTVDFHRRNLLEKMNVDNVLQLHRKVYGTAP